MTARIDPSAVSDTLVSLTRSLGEPHRDLVIMAEGNTSELVAPGTIAVKASGSAMAAAGQDDFVVVDIDPLIAIMRDPSSSQEQLSTALTATAGDVVRKASIETLVHVAFRAFSDVRFVAHTHPTAVVSLLASVHAPVAFAGPVYTEELLTLGVPLYVPYAEPGIELGRVVLEAMAEYVGQHGRVPSLVLLGNHGIIAASDTAPGIEAVSTMAVKSAQVRVGALSAGGIAPIDPERVAHYFQRPDFIERSAHLSGRSA